MVLSLSLPFVCSVVHDGDVTLDQVIEIARVMRPRSMARTLAGTVKEILGTCFRYVFFTSFLSFHSHSKPGNKRLTFFSLLCSSLSIGCTVNGEHPRDIQKQIDDEEIEIPE